MLRVFFYWSQLEPEPGRYDWSAVDAVLDQAASSWATRRKTDFLPASPPTDPQTNAQMVHALVEHCAGRVRWWQCQNEPRNPMFWAGDADEYLGHLGTFSDAVRSADPGVRR